MIEIEEYRRDNQVSPFDEWFSSLSVPAATRVSTALIRLEMGNTSNIKWFDGLGEYCIDWGPGLRIYLIQEGPINHPVRWRRQVQPKARYQCRKVADR